METVITRYMRATVNQSSKVRKVSEITVPFKCISCGACVKACPEGALELVEIELDEIEETVYSYQGVC